MGIYKNINLHKFLISNFQYFLSFNLFIILRLHHLWIFSSPYCLLKEFSISLKIKDYWQSMFILLFNWFLTKIKKTEQLFFLIFNPFRFFTTHIFGDSFSFSDFNFRFEIQCRFMPVYLLYYCDQDDSLVQFPALKNIVS